MSPPVTEPTTEPTAPGVRARVVDVANRIGERFLRWLDRYYAKHSLVGDHAYFDPDDFPWVRRVEARWPAIRAELDDVLRDVEHLPNFQDISTDQYKLTQDDRWKTYFLLGYGFQVDDHLARCPETARALREVPGITTAMFSIFAPHKQIPVHGGPYKGVLRYHLGLKVPEPRDSCGITVRGETRHWEEGRSLVFDDVWDHEAWNDTDGTRVVLFVDFVRPMRAPASWLNAIVLRAIAYSPFVQDGKARHKAWEKRFEEIRGHAA
jgi:aspartyl/asparaginyl beta-hydroxylase (cupin superfamily)